MEPTPSFRRLLREELSNYVSSQGQRFPAEETLRVDLHCHDRNSDEPDELMGRLLRCPETWTPTDEVVDALRTAGMNAITITNHNNARSCYELLERGEDVLVGAEFTCKVPDYDARVHVLTYGFEAAQEARLLELRHNIYRFLDYTRTHDLPTVLAHPLHFSSTSTSAPPIEFLEKLTLLFDNFETINGQRDSWQNLLMARWLEALDEERVEAMAARAGIRSTTFCRRPYSKRVTGGSDCHTALFVGRSHTLVRVPRLAERGGESRAALVLQGLRDGELAPFGTYTCHEKLEAALLSFFCDAAINLRDPGLVRLLLHQGESRDKLTALVVANMMMEIRRHRFTLRFLRAFHAALQGKRPGFLLRRVVARPLRPLVKELDAVAVARRHDPSEFADRVEHLIPLFFRQLANILAGRITEKLRRMPEASRSSPAAAADAVRRMEVPAQLRSLLGGSEAAEAWSDISEVSLGELTDGLSFPFLSALVVGGISFATSRVLFQNRRFLDRVATAVGDLRHPRRALWLTDTFDDRNGVASSLRLLHREVKRRNLPLDLLVCSDRVEPDDHLIVLPPLAEFRTPLYPDQPFRVFDLLQLQRVFVEGGYDRVVSSTEALTGVAALYLKQAFSVPAFFYLHTDWIDFARRALGFERRGIDRVRRMLRAFYRSFDGLLVLNREQREWLASDAMGIPVERLHATAHWVDPIFRPQPVLREEAVPGLRTGEKVVLFAGRLSEEKGVLELPALMRNIRRHIPAARLVVAGCGPAEDRLRTELPDTTFCGWVPQAELARLFAAADLMLLPSRFDTFGCAVLEALSCGLPVVAYRVKGPADIILDGDCGFVADDIEELAHKAVRVLSDVDLQNAMSSAALERAAAYRPEVILADLMHDLGLDAEGERSRSPTPEEWLFRVAI